jgi:hypothetical protein
MTFRTPTYKDWRMQRMINMGDSLPPQMFSADGNITHEYINYTALGLLVELVSHLEAVLKKHSGQITTGFDNDLGPILVCIRTVLLIVTTTYNPKDYDRLGEVWSKIHCGYIQY